MQYKIELIENIILFMRFYLEIPKIWNWINRLFKDWKGAEPWTCLVNHTLYVRKTFIWIILCKTIAGKIRFDIGVWRFSTDHWIVCYIQGNVSYVNPEKYLQENWIGSECIGISSRLRIVVSVVLFVESNFHSRIYLLVSWKLRR